MMKQRFLHTLRLLTVAGLVLGTAGCLTIPEEDDSDLPWNTPQQWESAPSIPGLNGGGF